MAYNMEWFRKQAELKKKKEEEAKKSGKELPKSNSAFEKSLDLIPPDESQLIEKSSKSTYFNFHKNKNSANNPHYFMTEELLTPRASNSDTQRLNMFANHITQSVHLKTPEYPRVFTNFEDQIGEYSIAYKKADDDFTVVRKIIKNAYNYDLIVRYKHSGEYDIIHFNTARNITEDYGYKLNSCLPDDIAPGDTVEKGKWLYKSDNYDEDGNYGYGVNLRALYMPFLNLTYEDI